MNDYISREAVIDSLQDWKDHCMTDAEEWHIRQVIGDVKSLPTADVKPVVHSYWEKDPDGGCVCHKCRERPLLDGSEEPVLSDFCPNCGADMNKEKSTITDKP